MKEKKYSLVNNKTVKIPGKTFFLSLFLTIILISVPVLSSCKEENKISQASDAQVSMPEDNLESSPEEIPETTAEETIAQPPENYYISDLKNADNYSFICPDGWQLFETGSGMSVLLQNTKVSENESENIYIFIEDELSAKGLSGEKAIIENYMNFISGGPTVEVFENEEIKIGAIDAVLAGYNYISRLEEEYSVKNKSIDLFTYIENNDRLYCIKYIGLNKDSQHAKEVFNDFLMTFSLEDQKEKIKQKDENSRINILILGDDSGLGRPGGRVNGRTDIIILLHLNLDTGKGTAVTIPRDTWVDIPGHGEGKITGAHAIGGNELAVKAVEELSGLQIDNYIITDFDGFIPLIDFLGGVTVEVGEDLADGFSGCYLSKGVHHLNGEQALALSRNRHRSGDGTTQSGAFAREREAAKIIVALIDQKSTFERIVAMPALVNYLVNYTWTDLRFADILKLLPVLGRIKASDIEITGIPSWPETIGKASAVAYDKEATAILFEEVGSQ